MEDKTVQKNKKKKQGVKLSPKPYLKGKAVSALAFRRSWKVLLYYIIYIFFFLIIGSSLNFDSMLLRLLTNGIVIIGTVVLMLNEGARVGDGDVAFAEIAWGRQEAGKSVDEGDMDRCFHPLKGVVTALTGAAPFLIASIVYAFLAQKQTYTLQALPGWLSSYAGVEEIAQPLAYYQQTVAFTGVDVVRMITRLCIFPYMNIVTVDNAAGVLVLDRISPLLILLPALGYMAGYCMGPRSRAMTHGSIESNNRRRARQQKKAARARKQKDNTII